MYKRLAPFSLLILVSIIAALAASPAIKPISVKGSGDFTHDARLMVDGVFIDKGDAWDNLRCVHWTELDVCFDLDLGDMYQLTELTLQVDNNDVYRLDYSADGQKYTPLVTISADFGEIDDGMDVFSSDAGHADFVAALDFKPVTARYLRLLALEGDGAFSVAEIQIIGEPVEAVTGWPAVKGHGAFNNKPTLLVDDKIVEEGTAWTDDQTVHWSDPGVYFIIDYGKIRPIFDVMIQVDNNDDYIVDYSVDGTAYTRLFAISSDDGNVAHGMDTMISLDSHPAYEPKIDFKPVRARFLKVYALGGDGLYAVTEVDAR
ncbi:MAG TPA: discoidin domain-containing protein [Acidobacteriota bacterium]|nr:discoidin domain-containing protein [Acidobacteriota bacterium]HNU00548.1 discoidin domain-containing protein [Acidobacteriota bacterium]HPB27594.1 discoidin domain-containing protein [Acidobacteriota bacterium]HQO24283.1 discoidin domain-containing protein [Acidobacteriota bacterium]HQP73317.1 discoidin domain-containing protein [Acidobacteriota bacterium]